MAVFLHHSRRRAGDPDISVRIEVTGVQPRVEQLQITPGVHHITVRIKLDDRGRELPGVEFPIENILPVQDQHVVLRIHAYSPQSAQNPAIGKRLWPGQVGFEFGRRCLRACRRGSEDCSRGDDGDAYAHDFYLSGRVKTYRALPFWGCLMSGSMVRGTLRGLPPPSPVGTAIYSLPSTANATGNP